MLRRGGAPFVPKCGSTLISTRNATIIRRQSSDTRIQLTSASGVADFSVARSAASDSPKAESGRTPEGAVVRWAMQLLLVPVQRGNAEMYRRSGLIISREQGLRFDADFAVPVLMS